MDLAISNDGTGWDLKLTDGDLVMHVEDSAEDVAQRVVYRLSTWRGESPFDALAGVPYLDGVFGYEPVAGVVALLRNVIETTEGVAEVLGDPDFVLDQTTRTLAISCVIRVGTAEVPIQLKVTP